MKQNIKIRIITLEKEAQLLRMITNIRKAILSSGAYSEKNMEKQNMSFDRSNVPEWERQIIQKSWEATRILSHSLLKELDELSKEVLKEYRGDDNLSKYDNDKKSIYIKKNKEGKYE